MIKAQKKIVIAGGSIVGLFIDKKMLGINPDFKK